MRIYRVHYVTGTRGEERTYDIRLSEYFPDKMNLEWLFATSEAIEKCGKHEKIKSIEQISE